MKEEEIIVVESNVTKNRYVVLSDRGNLMKDRENNLWYDCVIYRDYKHYSPDLKDYVEVPEDLRKTYVREKNEFIKQFSLVLDL